MVALGRLLCTRNERFSKFYQKSFQQQDCPPFLRMIFFFVSLDGYHCCRALSIGYLPHSEWLLDSGGNDKFHITKVFCLQEEHLLLQPLLSWQVGLVIYKAWDTDTAQIGRHNNVKQEIRTYLYIRSKNKNVNRLIQELWVHVNLSLAQLLKNVLSEKCAMCFLLHNVQ